MSKYCFDLNEIVYVPDENSYGKIIDVRVAPDNNTEYMIVFDNGTWNSFYGYQIKGAGLNVL
jgi:hypothetical protein